MKPDADELEIEYPRETSHRESFLIRFAERSPAHAKVVKYTLL